MVKRSRHTVTLTAKEKKQKNYFAKAFKIYKKGTKPDAAAKWSDYMNAILIDLSTLSTVDSNWTNEKKDKQRHRDHLAPSLQIESAPN